MPISQTTVLALYGELRAVTLLIEREAEWLLELAAQQETDEASETIVQRLTAMRRASQAAERHAIEIMLEEVPRVKINPLTGALM